MSRKLSKANPYMRNPDSRERGVIKSVVSSSAIEGINVRFTKVETLKARPATKVVALRKKGGSRIKSRPPTSKSAR